MDLVKEITVKSNSLPFEMQREILDFVEFIAHKNQSATLRNAATAVSERARNLETSKSG